MQISMFSGTKKFENTKPIRLIELFGGIQAQATALHELGVEWQPKVERLIEILKERK